MFKATALLLALPLLANAADKPSGTLITANQGPNNLAMIDLATGKQVGTLDEQGKIKVHELLMLPDGKTLIAPIYGDAGVGRAGTDGSEILVYDVPSRKVVHMIDLGKGLRPHQPTYDAKRKVIYVTTELQQAMTAIDAKTFKVLYTVPTGQPESHMFVLSHDGRFGYTSNVGPGTVSVMDMDTHKLVTTIPVAKHLQRISISRDDKTVFTSDTSTPRVAAIDTATNTLRTWIDLPSPGFGSKPTADGKYLLICMPDASKLGLIDMATLKLIKTIDVAGKPQEILFSPDGSRAWASSFGVPQIAEIDTATWTLTRELPGTDRNDGMAYTALH
ncbi:MAG: beta-propeller fold lactonase family protein [Janthinobacterium lividum]